MSERRPWAEAHATAQEIKTLLAPFCHRIEIAGSIRRMKETVKDIELVYIPKVDDRVQPGDMFAQPTNLLDAQLDELLKTHVIAKRLNRLGREAYGPFNKLIVHVRSQISVDLFATSDAAWYSYLVCRTGGAEFNTFLAGTALRHGLQWHPYAGGFGPTNSNTCTLWPSSEEEVLSMAGIPNYISPENRA